MLILICICVSACKSLDYHKLSQGSHGVAKAIDAYRFNEAADQIYHFIWNDYCDWYLEFIKPVLKESEETQSKQLSLCLRAASYSSSDDALYHRRAE